MRTWIAFAGTNRLAKGRPQDVAAAVKAYAADGAGVLVFDAESSAPIELDLQGELAEVLARLNVSLEEPKRGRGRPRLGVVSKEVTLLPRHWNWLQGQNGGASVTLRKLVETAMRAEPDAASRQQSLESAYKFMTAMAGNEPGYEDATRALFAKDAAKFRKFSRKWPRDVKRHARKLASLALGEPI